MNDGDRKHLFTIKEPTRVKVGQDRVPTWNTVGTRWGSLTVQSANETVVSEQISPRTTYKIEILYFEGLTSKHVLTKGSRIFRIVGPPVDPDEEKFLHVLTVVEMEFENEVI